MSDYRKFDAALQSAGVCYKTDEPMSAHTSFKIGGPADRFVEVKTVSELQAVLNAVSDENVPYFILGNGSNLLVPDEGLRGAVLTLQGDFKKVQSLANGHVLCGAGASLATVCSFARGQGLTGLEFAWGIPGQLGGAVYMNAGAYGGEMKQVVVRVHFLEADGTPGVMSGEDLAFGYRKSAFMGTKRIITSAELCLESGAEAEITAKMEDFMRRRREKQPLELPSAGSVFKRPEGYFAGTLIEQCGLKGFAVGGARVSEKHAGFIVNKGGATCADVEALIRAIQDTVFQATGVELEPEIRRISLSK